MTWKVFACAGRLLGSFFFMKFKTPSPKVLNLCPLFYSELFSFSYLFVAYRVYYLLENNIANVFL